MAKKHSTDPTLRELERELYSTTQALKEAYIRFDYVCDSCIHETAKRQPGHWYGLAFEPVLKGTRV